MPERPPAGHLEREVKLGAWPGFVLPSLDGVLPWVRVGEQRRETLDALYVDTVDLRLLRWGITVRHRTGEGEPRWTVKIPADLGGDAAGGGTVLHRVEHERPGERATVPPELDDLLRAFVRTATLVPVARLSTHRRSWQLLDAGDRLVGVVDDDEVSVLDDDRVAARFREVEAEILPGVSPELLEAVVGRLRAAGAGAPDPTPKLVRALGPRALAPPEVVAPEVGRDATIGQVVHRAIATSVVRVLAHDPAVRLDAGVEAVHQARVGTRRLRSDLRTFDAVLDPAWTEHLRDELRWLGGVLGGVRDLDVLGERIGRAVGHLDPDDRRAAAPLLARLAAERAEVLAAALGDLSSERYAVLLDDLVAAAREPQLAPGAARPADEALADLVRRPWRKLVKLVDEVTARGAAPTDEQLHAVRIRAKRARYAADAAAGAVKAAGRHAAAIAEVQGALGDHHDAVVAGAWLRTAAAGQPTATALVAGQLVAAERVEAAAARDAWRAAWDEASRPKRSRWL